MTRSIRFDDWVWDPNTLELRNGSHVATLEPRVAKLFEYMVAHPGELLSRDQLVDVVWDGRVVSDDAVRRAVFNLRQAFVAGGSESYIRTVHKKGYVATFPQPVETDLETRNDLTATISSTAERDAVVTKSPVQGGVSVTRADTSRRWLYVLGIIAALALTAVVLTQFDMVREPEPSSKHTDVPTKTPATIAVLPFINLSEAADNQLLADGLTEELFGTLERNRGLRVTARGSAFQFKDEGRDARELGGRLGVRYVLEGDIRRNAEHVLVKATLVDSQTGTQLWTQTYDRPFTDWFAVQQDIAVDVASAVQRILQKKVEAITLPDRAVNAEAQLELLRARQLLITQSVEDAEQAIEHLQRALTLDPNYALAYARLADAILIDAGSTNSMSAARPVIASLLEKALALDPSLGEAYAIRSMITDDKAAAEHDLRRALELNPSYARGYEMLANVQSNNGQLDLAIGTADSAIALNPLSPSNFHTKAGLMLVKGDWPEVVRLDRRALELQPKFRAALVNLGLVSALQGNFADAVDYSEQAVALDPRAVSVRENLIQVYLAIGDIGNARAVNTSTTVDDRLVMSWSEGDIQQTAEKMYGGDFGPADKLNSMFVSQIVLMQALADQNFTRAHKLLSSALAFTGSVPPDAGGWGLYAYANMAQLLDASGETTAASQLQEQINERMAVHESRCPRCVLLYDQIRAVMFAHAGQSDAACAALERTYTPNPRILWRMILSNPAFDNMRAVPCFSSLRTRVEAHVAAERERIDAMRSAGQIPDRLSDNTERDTDVAR